MNWTSAASLRVVQHPFFFLSCLSFPFCIFLAVHRPSRNINHCLFSVSILAARCPSSPFTGTPAFLAPECCQIGEFHTKRADVWAAGVSMYYMLFGAVPFTDASEMCSIAGQMLAIVEQPLSYPQGHSISPHALELLSQLLEKDPEKRISLDSALLSPWIVAAKSAWPSHLKRLPSGLPDNDILSEATPEDVRGAVINVSNWSLLVKVKLIASRHVQGFRDRRKSQDDGLSAKSTAEFISQEHAVPPLATS